MRSASSLDDHGHPVNLKGESRWRMHSASRKDDHGHSVNLKGESCTTLAHAQYEKVHLSEWTMWSVG